MQFNIPSRPQLQRWFAFYDSNAENRGTRWSKFAILIYTLLKEGKLPSVSSFHIFASAARSRDVRLVPAPAAASSCPPGRQANPKPQGKKRGRPPRSRKPGPEPHPGASSGSGAPGAHQAADASVPADQKIEEGCPAAEHPDALPEEGSGKKLKELFSAMQAAAIALSSEHNSLGMDIIHFLVAPIRRAYAHIQESVRGGPGAIRTLFSELAVGSMQGANIEIWMCLQTPEVLSACGLTLERALLCEDDVFDGDPIVLEQDAVAKKLDRFALSLIAERVDESCTHQHDFVGRCAGLLHRDPALREQTLQDLQGQARAFRRALRETGSATLRSIISQSSFQGSIEKVTRQSFF